MALTDCTKVIREQGRSLKRSTLLTNVLAVVLRPLESCLGTDAKAQKENDASLAASVLLNSFREENRQSMSNSKLAESLNEIRLVGWLWPHILLLHGPEEDLETLRQAWRRRSLRNPAGFFIKDLGDLQDVVLESIVPAQFMSLTTALHDLVTDLNNCGHCPSQGMITFYLKQLYTDMRVPDKDTMHKCLGMLIQERRVYHNGRGYVALHEEVDFEELRQSLKSESRKGKSSNAKSREKKPCTNRVNFSPDDMSLLSGRESSRLDYETTPNRDDHSIKDTDENMVRGDAQNRLFPLHSDSVAVDREKRRKRKNVKAENTHRNSFMSYSDDERMKISSSRKSPRMLEPERRAVNRQKSEYRKRNADLPKCLFGCVSSKALAESQTNCAAPGNEYGSWNEQSVDEQSIGVSVNTEGTSHTSSDISARLNGSSKNRSSFRERSSDSSRGQKQRKPKGEKKRTKDSNFMSDEVFSFGNDIKTVAAANGIDVDNKKLNKKVHSHSTKTQEVDTSPRQPSNSTQNLPSVTETSHHSKETENVEISDKRKHKKLKSRKTQTDFENRQENADGKERTVRDELDQSFEHRKQSKSDHKHKSFHDTAQSKSPKTYSNPQASASVVPIVFDVEVNHGNDVVERATVNKESLSVDLTKKEVSEKQEKSKKKKAKRSNSYCEPSKSKRDSQKLIYDWPTDHGVMYSVENEGVQDSVNLKMASGHEHERVKGRRELRLVEPCHPYAADRNGNCLQRPEESNSKPKPQEAHIVKLPLSHYSRNKNQGQSNGQRLDSNCDQNLEDKTEVVQQFDHTNDIPVVITPVSPLEKEKIGRNPDTCSRKGEDTDLEDLRAFVLVGSNKQNPLYRHISNESFCWNIKDEPECDQQSDQWTWQSDADSNQRVPFAKPNLKRWENVQSQLAVAKPDERSGNYKTPKNVVKRRSKSHDNEKRRSMPVYFDQNSPIAKGEKDVRKHIINAGSSKSGSMSSLAGTPSGSVELRDKRARHSAMFEEKRLSLKVMGMV